MVMCEAKLLTKSCFRNILSLLVHLQTMSSNFNLSENKPIKVHWRLASDQRTKGLYLGDVTGDAPVN